MVIYVYEADTLTGAAGALGTSAAKILTSADGFELP